MLLPSYISISQPLSLWQIMSSLPLYRWYNYGQHHEYPQTMTWWKYLGTEVEKHCLICYLAGSWIRLIIIMDARWSLVLGLTSKIYHIRRSTESLQPSLHHNVFLFEDSKCHALVCSVLFSWRSSSSQNMTGKTVHGFIVVFKYQKDVLSL